MMAPRLQMDVSQPELVFGHVITSIAPPPEMQPPPLWSDVRSLDRLEGMAWPPRRHEVPA